MKILAVSLTLLVIPLLSPAQSPTNSSAEAKAETKLLPRFPDFGFLPPPGDYNSRIFRLSQAYPKEKPATEPAIAKILSIDFKKDWQPYIEAVRDYIYEGNIDAGRGRQRFLS
jgi:hypothetical protein